MNKVVNIKGVPVNIVSLNTVVVGTGCAGYNAADRIFDYGQTDVAIVTEGINMGTSRNTGSDKQTYYKLTLAGGGSDSVLDMAQTLFEGGCMDGDIALCEASLSAQCFFKLVEAGVPFPHNAEGEYVGYKTDHDPRQRATSVGPLTSKFMTQQLEKRVKAKNIKIFDGYLVIGVITQNGKSIGLVAFDKNKAGKDDCFTVFNCTNVVFATGGPAGLYENSVFPESQTGSHGVCFEAGVLGKNLTEWQYGIASTKFRWNLSGTYQQVLPRYVSTNPDGSDPREFLDEYFTDTGRMLDCIFLKGYQWPFDPRKIENYGSSIVDILVYNEIQNKGRRVYLDFLNNPTCLKADFSNLNEESYTYLKNSNALFGNPIERLQHMNPAAIDLYRDNGIDITKELLEIAVSAQHNNGGLSGDSWWQSNVENFFVVGEANGSHGIYRPGGSALNSGQVGSTRAAMYISKKYTQPPMEVEAFLAQAQGAIEQKIDMVNRLKNSTGAENVLEIRQNIGKRMSGNASHIRSLDGAVKVMEEAKAELEAAYNSKPKNEHEMAIALGNIDLLIAQYVYASSFADYIKTGGGSRGSYLVQDEKGVRALEKLGDAFKFMPDSGTRNDMVQEIAYKDGDCSISWRKIRQIPETNDWFENVWADYRNNVYYK